MEIASIGRDPDAFEAFYRANIELILRFIARRVDDPYLAADLAAEVFLAVIDSADSYRPGRGTPRGWLYGIARNVVNAERRRNARELRASNQVAGRRHVDLDDLARLEERIDAEADARALHRAMDQLSKAERAVVELVAMDGLDLTDAAKVLRISRSNARVRLHRARRKLHHHLDQLAAPSTTAALPKPSEARS